MSYFLVLGIFILVLLLVILIAIIFAIREIKKLKTKVKIVRSELLQLQLSLTDDCK